MIYAYCRVSSGKQLEGLSMSLQNDTSLLEDIAKKYNTNVSERVYSDEGRSAYKGDNLKGELGTLIEDTKDLFDKESGALIKSALIKPGDIIVMRHLDRLSRLGLTAAMQVYGDIMSKGVSIYTTMDEKLYEKDDQVSQLLATLALNTANEESKKKSHLTNRHARERIEQFLAGVRDADGNAFDVGVGGVPAHAEIKNKSVVKSKNFKVIKRLIDFYLDANGLAKCSTFLENEGLNYTTAGISSLLKSTSLYGTLSITTKGTRYELENYYHAVIDKETYRLIQARLGSNKSSNGGRKQHTLLAGGKFLFCGCGSSMAASHTKQGIKYYACINNKCKFIIQKYTLDNLVLQHLASYMFVQKENKYDDIKQKLAYSKQLLREKTKVAMSLEGIGDMDIVTAQLRAIKSDIDSYEEELLNATVKSKLELEDYSLWQGNIEDILSSNSDVQGEYKKRISKAVTSIICHRDGLVKITTVDDKDSYYYFAEQNMTQGRRLGMRLFVGDKELIKDIRKDAQLKYTAFTVDEIKNKKYQCHIDDLSDGLYTLYSEEHTRYTAAEEFVNIILKQVTSHGYILFTKKKALSLGITDKQWQSNKSRTLALIQKKALIKDVQYITEKNNKASVRVITGNDILDSELNTVLKHVLNSRSIIKSEVINKTTSHT